MNKQISLAALSALALLAACGGAPENTAVAVDETANRVAPAPAPVPGTPANVASDVSETVLPALNLAPDGLSLVQQSGSTRHAIFGLPKAAATRMIEAALGSPIEEATNEECGAGPLDYAAFRQGLSLYFQEGKFAGWDLDGRENGKFSTANGIGIGMTRAALEAAAGPLKVEESSIGHEFTIGDMSGLLSSPAADGKVTNLWAGVNCIAR